MVGAHRGLYPRYCPDEPVPKKEARQCVVAPLSNVSGMSSELAFLKKSKQENLSDMDL